MLIRVELQDRARAEPARFPRNGSHRVAGEGPTAPSKSKILKMPMWGYKKGLRAAVDRAHCGDQEQKFDCVDWGL